MTNTVPRKTRRTQDERSSETQRRILDAAFEVLREKGYHNFTTYDVAARAGVSRGAQLHHFPSKNDLIAAAMEHVLNQSAARSKARTLAFRRAQDPVGAMFKDASDFYFSDHFGVGLDMLLASTKNPEFKDQAVKVVRNYREPVEQEWLSVMIRLGFPEAMADELLWLTMTILRGAAVRNIWQNDPKQIKKCLAVWRRVVTLYLDDAARTAAGTAGQAKPEKTGSRAKPRPAGRAAE